MAAGDITLMPKFLQAQADASTLSGSPVDFDTDTIKVVVLINTFVPDTTDSSAQEHFDDISSDEVNTATAYTGPITLTTTSIAVSGAVVTWDADDISIAADVAGFTDGRYIAIYKDTGTPATSPIIAIGDLGADQSLQTGSLDLTWAATGLITWTRV